MADVASGTGMEPLSTSFDKSCILSRLDDLLEEYLNTLDQYQNAQQTLSKQMSSGHLSLAQAQFSNTSYTRYGQDYYDQRMHASRTVAVTENDIKIRFTGSRTDEPESSSEDKAQGEPKKGIPSDVKDTSENEKKSTLDPSHSNSKRNDPLRWFGILVPPALRTAQTSFISVVEGPVPELSILSKELRRLEIEIGRARKQAKKK